MNASDRIVILEEIAASPDPSVTARDRIRALELLDDLEVSEPRLSAVSGAETSALEPDESAEDEFNSELDRHYALAIIAILEGNQDFIDHLPAIASVIRCVAAGKTEELLRALRERASPGTASSSPREPLDEATPYPPIGPV